MVVDLSLENLERISAFKSKTGLPVLVAGVASRNDALKCLQYELDAIVVTTNCEDQLTTVCGNSEFMYFYVILQELNFVVEPIRQI